MATTAEVYIPAWCVQMALWRPLPTFITLEKTAQLISTDIYIYIICIYVFICIFYYFIMLPIIQYFNIIMNIVYIRLINIENCKVFISPSKRIFDFEFANRLRDCLGKVGRISIQEKQTSIASMFLSLCIGIRRDFLGNP